MSVPFKIAIIGAGPGGCTLARILLQSTSKAHITIFESEASPDIRSQGGSLDLHKTTGLKALREAGLYDQFVEHARFDGEALVIADKKLTKYLSVGGATEGKGLGTPEIDRRRLREILLKSLPSDVVRWGCRLRSVDADLRLHFEHGIEEGFDLIVGADGAWSKVRPLLTDAKPYYSGLSGYGLTIPDGKAYPDLDKLVNRGSVFSYSDGKSIGTQQMGDGSLHVSLWAISDELSRDEQGDIADGKAAKEVLSERYHDWHPQLRKFIQVSDIDNITAKSLYMLPIGVRWDSRPGATLLGDAAHLATPFAGIGVNVAMQDAMNLAHAIMAAEEVGTKDALDANVRAFEEEMFVRGRTMQEHTYGNMNDMFFTEGAPRTVIESWMIRGMKARAGIHGLKLAVLGSCIYIYMFFFKLFH